jgi:hypothetical protein
LAQVAAAVVHTKTLTELLRHHTSRIFHERNFLSVFESSVLAFEPICLFFCFG